MNLRLCFMWLFLVLAVTVAAGQPSSHPSMAAGPRSPQGFPPFPAEMSFQGLMTLPDGTPAADGIYTLKFEIYPYLVGGSAYWSETKSSVNVQRGTFKVMLGSDTALPAFFYQTLYVQTSAMSGPGISSPVVFSPRAELAAAAYSLGPWQSIFNDVYVPYAWVGIGTTGAPSAPLEVRGGSDPLVQLSGWGQSVLQFATSDTPKWAFYVPGNGPDFALWHYPPPIQDYIYANGTTGDVTFPGGLGRVGIGTVSPLSTAKLDVQAHSRYAANFVSDSLSSLSSVINAQSTASGHADVTGVTAFSAPDDYYGIGGIFTGGYQGIEGLVSPTGSNTYTAVFGQVSGGTGFNYGMQGAAFGSGYNYGVVGIAVGGLNNFGGLFIGELQVSTSNGGDSTVQLPQDAISSFEILDEPGIARAVGSFVSVSVPVNLTSVTVTPPADGYVELRGHAYAAITGTTIGNVACSIDTASATVPPGQYDIFGSADETVASSITRYGSLAPERIFPVTGGKIYTFYLNASRGFSGGTVTVFYPKLVATYYSTSYGPVAASVPSDIAAKYTNATPETVPPSTISSGVPTVPQQLYRVDLRELELRALQARIASERAQRDLLEARLAQDRQKSATAHRPR